MTIKFGTDGWRGIIADDFTFDNVRLCAQGVSLYLKDQGLAQRGLVVGYDTRFASEDFALAVAEVSTGNGVKTLLCREAAPTPVVSYSIVERHAGGAAMITASHNPARWNGFKYKPEYAGSASPEVVAALEESIARAQEAGRVMSTPWERALGGGAGELIDVASPYLRHVAAMVDLQAIKTAGLKVVADAMYGAGAGYIPALLDGGSITIQELHGERNPLFPGMAQPEPVAYNLHDLSTAVVKQGADVGLALDGDADRFGLVDERGEFITPLQVFALLALYLLEIRGETGALVKSLTATSMVYRLGERFNIPVHETPVGFKYIGPVMMRENALMGGEESGGFGFRGHIPERDGILSALFVLDMMVRTGKRPSELLQYLFSQVGPHHYKRTDIAFAAEKRSILEKRLREASPDALGGMKVARRDDVDGRRFILEDGSWAIIRFSGTEPLLRIYAEGGGVDWVDTLIAEARGLVGV
ncbi:MAG: phosphoglucomutase/phosphomannomutase family protein [Chloroflexi bacterium]|nr:phosphoglucomutase/phosphomannomutase family protein [Chloroflexota bacterium]